MHEDPQVPNYGQRGAGTKLREGMVLAIEPMVNAGKPGVQVLSDGWTAVTEDGSLECALRAHGCRDGRRPVGFDAIRVDIWF